MTVTHIAPRPLQIRDLRAAARENGIPEGLRPSSGRVEACALLSPSAPAPTPSKRHLRVVQAPARSPEARSRRVRALFIASIAVGLLVAFGLVYSHVVLAQRQFNVDQLNAEVQDQQNVYQNLRLQVAELGSPEHIISTAEGQLGMVQPASVTYLPPTTVVPSTPTQAAVSSHTSSSYPEAPAGDANWPEVKSRLAGSS